MSAAEALGVLHEAAAAAFGQDYRFPNHAHMLDMLEGLITDSLKYRAKKDRRTQRYTIRHVYSALKVFFIFSSQIYFCKISLFLVNVCIGLVGSRNTNCKREIW